MWSIFKAAAVNWMSHKDARLGAALAYYSIFSLGPIVVIAITIAGLDHQKKSDAGKGDSPCTFAGHGAPLLAAADPIVLAIAIVFIMATVFRVVSRGVADRVAYLRPPLRGPPAAV